MTSAKPLLALDTGSPTVSVALAIDGEVHGRTEPQSRSSSQAARLADGLLDQLNLSWPDLGGVVAARGPGSFTGLRVGLAFALGLHQALAVPATAISTHRLLAEACPLDEPVLAVIPAWRNSWFIQPFSGPPRRAEGPPQRLDDERFAALESGHAQVALTAIDDATFVPDESIAAAAARMSASPHFDWDPTTLQAPLYLAPPPTHRAPSPKEPANRDAT